MINTLLPNQFKFAKIGVNQIEAISDPSDRVGQLKIISIDFTEPFLFRHPVQITYFTKNIFIILKCASSHQLLPDNNEKLTKDMVSCIF